MIFKPLEKQNINSPPLDNGDRLTRVEFETRYHRMPHVKKSCKVGQEITHPTSTD